MAAAISPPSCHRCQQIDSTRSDVELLLKSSSFQLTQLTLNNDEPTETDRAQALGIISRGGAYHADLQTRILGREMELEDLRQQSSLLQKAIQGHTSILSMCRRLPVEILHEIFLHLVDHYSTPYNLGKTSSWRVARVCRAWRAAALGCSKLWTHIRVKLDGELSLRRIQFFLDLQIRRSASLPLSVLFTDDAECLSQNLPVVSTLVSSSERWETLTLNISLYDYSCLEGIRGRLHRLKQLSVLPSEDSYGFPIPIPKLPDFFQSAPNLTQITGTPKILAALPLPWKQIMEYRSRFDVGKPSSYYSRFNLDLLRVARRLRFAKIHADSDGDDLERRVTNSSLRKLVIEGDDVQAMFAKLTIPALRILLVNRTITDLSLLADFLTRSSCPLRTLQIRLPKFVLPERSISDMLHVFATVPSLQKLTIYRLNADVRAAFIRQMLAPESGALLPLLKSACLLTTPISAIEEDLLQELKTLRPNLQVTSR